MCSQQNLTTGSKSVTICQLLSYGSTFLLGAPRRNRPLSSPCGYLLITQHGHWLHCQQQLWVLSCTSLREFGFSAFMISLHHSWKYLKLSGLSFQQSLREIWPRNGFKDPHSDQGNFCFSNGWCSAWWPLQHTGKLKVMTKYIFTDTSLFKDLFLHHLSSHQVSYNQLTP